MSRTRAVGIDLGTTFSAVSWLQDNGKSTMVVNSEGDILTPSVVLFDEREVIVGKEAKKIGALKATRYAECVKRDMGSAVYSRPICGDYMPPEVIQAWILKKLKADALRAVGPDMGVVITVPAFFDEPRRKATADAGAMATLSVLDVVNEPTAAALAFGEDLGYLDPSGGANEPLKVLVYDLGGGTFDVTLIELRPGDIRTIATDGDVRLGGRDWDQRLLEHAAEAYIKEHREDPRENPGSNQRLLVEVEEAKRTLSARNHTTVRVDHAGSFTEVKLSRNLFQQITEDLLDRTAYTTRQLVQGAGLNWKDINRVLLVGGATRMPMISKMIKELTGIEPDHRVHPDEAVARGAAIYAGYLLGKKIGSQRQPTFEVTNVNSHSLGIEGIDTKTGRKRNVVIIPRNTPLPAKVTEKFATKEENQNSVVVQVLEGESAIPAECTAIGRTAIKDLPPGLPKSWPVEVTYEYQSNGRLKVSGIVPGTHREVQLELERESTLSPERIARWKKAVDQDGGMDELLSIVADELKNARALSAPGRPAAAQTATTAAHLRPVAAIPTVTGIPLESASQPAAASPSAPTMQATLVSGPTRVQPSAPAGAQPAGGAWSSPNPAMQPVAMYPPPPQPLQPEAIRAARSAPTPSAPQAHRPEPQPAPSSGSHPPRRPPNKSQNSAVGNVLMFAFAAVLGLAIGYYLLCWINPKGNFLNVPPSWFPWQVEASADPDSPTPSDEGDAGP